MLLNTFFYIRETTKGDVNQVQIALNPEHEIYKGHFPGMPVVPGVCQLQLFKEVLEQLSEEKLQLIQESNLKFMAVLNPEEHVNLVLELKFSRESDTTIKASGTLSADNIKFFSTKSTYQIK